MKRRSIRRGRAAQRSLLKWWATRLPCITARNLFQSTLPKIWSVTSSENFRRPGRSKDTAQQVQKTKLLYRPEHQLVRQERLPVVRPRLLRRQVKRNDQQSYKPLHSHVASEGPVGR